MKNTLVAAAFAAVLTVPAFADPVFGTWKTIPDDNGRFGHIEIKQCGDTICGEMVASFEANGNKYKSDNLGKNIVWNMMLKKDGKYGGGKIWSPDRDKTYSSTWSWLTAATGSRLRAVLQSSVVTAEHGRG